ncbi:unnamed protein product [Leptosia nina]|uniref:Glycosyltransferase 2-like domain-containing protein n=1 Tax=Leptosia nina TaxID=320188 RepID=A0AAV1JBJ1_9NEOP
MTFNFCGLIFYEAFPKRVILKGSLSHTPFLCIRVVTKGIYPTLVLENIKKNLDTCTNIGLRNFIIEVVTDKAVNPPHHEKLREIVVPSEYETKNGTLYKARALHYCWEEGINKLDDSDWVVHLDEETLLTEDAVRGILNFAMNDNHTCGQGLITYANGEIVNWLTTFADTYRVAADMGMYRFQFKAFHKSYHGWKGSYMVLKASTEKHVSFDNGLEGSIIEDGYFAIKASSKGYSFDFIEGEMWEMSPFTVLDFMKQRKRWLQGTLVPGQDYFRFR